MKRLIVLLCMVLLSVGVCFGEICHFEIAGDANGDCKFDLADFAIMADGWLVDCQDTPDNLSCIPLDRDGDGFYSIEDCNDNDPNIYPGAPEIFGDGIDNDCDGSSSLEIIWVSINDSGAGMKDEDGNPVSHGGFTGEMSKYETTNAQYCQFLNKALVSEDIYVSSNRIYGSSGSNTGADFVGEIYIDTYAADPDSQITYSEGVFSVRSRDDYDMRNHPVVEISWYGAAAFCNYYGFRLPTEWQWQAAADYDGSYIYGCETTIDDSKANYDYANPLSLSSYPYTSPVDYFPSYGYGINDMAGNVWEWTDSIYSGSYRIVRGGCWGNYDRDCTVSDWRHYYPYNTNNGVGFRVCR